MRARGYDPPIPSGQWCLRPFCIPIPTRSHIIELSQRTLTVRMCGEVRVCNHFSRSITICDQHLINLHTFFISCIFKRFSSWSKPRSRTALPRAPGSATVTLTLLISATHFRDVRSLKKWFVLVAYLIWLCTHYSIILLCIYYTPFFYFVNTFLKSFTICLQLTFWAVKDCVYNKHETNP